MGSSPHNGEIWVKFWTWLKLLLDHWTVSVWGEQCDIKTWAFSAARLLRIWPHRHYAQDSNSSQPGSSSGWMLECYGWYAYYTHITLLCDMSIVGDQLILPSIYRFAAHIHSTLRRGLAVLVVGRLTFIDLRKLWNRESLKMVLLDAKNCTMLWFKCCGGWLFKRESYNTFLSTRHKRKENRGNSTVF